LFVSGFTIVRNATLFDYPTVESVRSLLPLVDEMIIAVGAGTDDTRDRLVAIGDPKIRILDTIWDDSLRRGGQVLAQQTNLALQECRGDWCFYLQADEVVHELDYDRLRRSMHRNFNRASVEGLRFRYHHFRAAYDIRDPLPYRSQVRIVRNGVGVHSYGDACGFQVNNRKIRWARTGAWIYHYGYVKPPARMAAKMHYFSSLYNGQNVVPSEALTSEDHEWDLRTCERFAGKHPQVMQERIASMTWETPAISLLPRWRNPHFWRGLFRKNTRTFRRWMGRE
jgi:glycosyltransferase involved in cell wall biosynthesis